MKTIASGPAASHRRVLGRMTAMLLTAAMIIGTGLFAALGETAEKAGSGLLLAIFISGLIALATGLSAASVGINFPEEGGAFTWSRKFGYICAALALFLNLRPVLDAANVFTLVWYSIVHFDALKLPKKKRLVWPVVSWLGLAGCLALFVLLPGWALATGGGTLALLVVIRWLTPRFAAGHAEEMNADRRPQ